MSRFTIPFMGGLGWRRFAQSFLICMSVGPLQSFVPLSQTARAAEGSVAVGAPLPALKIPDLKGGFFNNDRAKGKLTVVNFWATWCEACKVELLEMEEQFQVFKHEKDFQMVFVNLDKDPRQAVQWAKQSLKNPEAFINANYFDGGFTAVEALNVDSFPFTLVLDRKTQVIYKQKGFTKGEGSTEKIVELVRRMLKEGKFG